MPIAEILSQGDEVVCGQIADTNAAWLSERLTDLGFSVRRHSAVGDRLEDIVGLLQETSARCDLCISTGGLGPTEDDLTAAAAAKAFDLPLAFDEKAMADIEALYRRFGKPMPDSNQKQAWLPGGSQRLDNQWGTAPGFALSFGRCFFVFLPGVPREMCKLFERVVLPKLKERFDLNPGRLVTLRTVAIGESSLQQRLQGFDPHPAVLGFRTVPPENQVKLRIPASLPDTGVVALVDELRRRIGAPVFSIEGVDGEPGGDLVAAIEGRMTTADLSLASGEWGCGGHLAKLCASGRQAGRWYRGGQIHGLTPQPPTEPVSADFAEELASRARTEFGAKLGLGISLNADPKVSDGRPKPGTAHLVLEGEGVFEVRQIHLAGGPELLRTLAAAAGLDLLRRHLLSL